eukprot:gene53453-65292_t
MARAFWGFARVARMTTLPAFCTPVPLDKAYRLLNHGPTVLVSSAHAGEHNVMAAAWSMPLDFSPPKNVRSNVRELEGALRKILAYSRFNQKEISIQLAREALRDLLSIQNRQISVENIQKTV